MSTVKPIIKAAIVGISQAKPYLASGKSYKNLKFSIYNVEKIVETMAGRRYVQTACLHFIKLNNIITNTGGYIVLRIGEAMTINLSTPNSDIKVSKMQIIITVIHIHLI